MEKKLRRATWTRSPSGFALLAIGALLAGCEQDINQTFPLASETIEQVAPTNDGSPDIGFEQAGCRQPAGQGTVDPGISIFSMVFDVNGVELEVVPGETLSVDPGDRIRLIEVSLCIGSYFSNPGDVCVDLAPIADEGEILSAQHAGTHMGAIISDTITLAGPDTSWTLEESWVGFSLVVNHWTPVSTDDMDCAGGNCEQDDILIVFFE